MLIAGPVQGEFTDVSSRNRRDAAEGVTMSLQCMRDLMVYNNALAANQQWALKSR